MTCKHCNKELPNNKRKGSVYCNKTCSRAQYRLKHFGESEALTIAPATVGAIGELLVSADLLKRGYEVFRALSPSCSCDLVIQKEATLRSVEVKTGRYHSSGKLVYPYTNIKADITAVVTPTGIVYLPELS